MTENKVLKKAELSGKWVEVSEFLKKAKVTNTEIFMTGVLVWLLVKYAEKAPQLYELLHKLLDKLGNMDANTVETLSKVVTLLEEKKDVVASLANTLEKVDPDKVEKISKTLDTLSSLENTLEKLEKASKDLNIEEVTTHLEQAKTSLKKVLESVQKHKENITSLQAVIESLKDIKETREQLLQLAELLGAVNPKLKELKNSLDISASTT